MYDPGFPFLRPLLYGIGGLVFVGAAFAIVLVVAQSGSPESARVEERTLTLADRRADDVLVVRPASERASAFPAFAPEGVIVIPAPTGVDRMVAEAAIASSERRVETARRPWRLSEPHSPAALAPDEPEAEEPPAPEIVDQRPQDIQATHDEAPPIREDAEASTNGALEEEPDNRSWYGSEEYWREVAERRRAEREARRRRHGGWP